MVKLKINWKQRSTIRGAIWLVGGMIALVFLWFDRDSTGVMAIAASIAGGVGVALEDN